ncbi:MAG: type IV secretion protein DotH [Alphaproteobacteria bacterium]|nr:type IV secretion protein DotH [Alphaproteobacteria bacterium]
MYKLLLTTSVLLSLGGAALAQEVTAPSNSALEAYQANSPVDIVSQDDALPQVDGIRTDMQPLDVPDVPADVVIDMDPAMKSQEQIEAEIRQEAFDAVITGLFPLQPDQIQELLRHYDMTEEAVNSPVAGMPTPEISVQTVSLDPGATPLTIRTSPGHITTINLLDVTGAPWPIQDVSWAGDFEVVEPEEGGHIIRITPMEKFAYGNMAVRLLTLKTPVTISLRTDQTAVHYRVDARVPEYGPFAETPIIEGVEDLKAGNPLITSVLDGAPPQGAQKLKVSGADGRTSAYSLAGKTYVRTPLTLLSPGWDSSVSSADGMNVYSLNSTPVLLLSDNGRFIRAHLSQEEDLFDE